MRRNNFDKKVLLEPENMILMYARGAFPMADQSGEIDWYMPKIRTIIPLDNFNVPRSLRKFMDTCDFIYKYDENTIDVIEHCAGRKQTWITPELIKAYTQLHELGHVHSVEVYKDFVLVGGLYGITYKGVFFGESMFSFLPQSSKAALVKLIERLNLKGFEMLDIQFMTEHLKMFGAVEISFEEFQSKLISAYSRNAEF